MVEVVRHSSGYSRSSQQWSKIDPTVSMNTPPVFSHWNYVTTPFESSRRHNGRNCWRAPSAADKIHRTRFESENQPIQQKDKPASRLPFKFILQFMRCFRRIQKKIGAVQMNFRKAHYLFSLWGSVDRARWLRHFLAQAIIIPPILSLPSFAFDVVKTCSFCLCRAFPPKLLSS